MLAERDGWVRALAGVITGGVAISLLLTEAGSLGAAIIAAALAGLALGLLGGGWEGLVAQWAAIAVGWSAMAAGLAPSWAILAALAGIGVQAVTATVAFGVGYQLTDWRGARRRSATRGVRPGPAMTWAAPAGRSGVSTPSAPASGPDTSSAMSRRRRFRALHVRPPLAPGIGASSGQPTRGDRHA